MSGVASNDWGGSVHCAVCGIEARTNAPELLDGSEAYMCCDCEFAGAWGVEPDEITEIPLLQVCSASLPSDTVGMERLL